MDSALATGGVGTLLFGAVCGAIKLAWDAWQKDRTVVISTLQAGTTTAIERERGVTEALTRSTVSGERIVDALDDVRDALGLRECPNCGHRLHGRPSIEHPAAPRPGGAS